jgi:hypothetical protein
MYSFKVSTDHRNTYIIFADSPADACELCDLAHPDERSFAVLQLNTE